MKNFKWSETFVIINLSIVWVCKPVPYEVIAQKRYTRHENEINRVILVRNSDSMTDPAFLPGANIGRTQNGAQNRAQNFKPGPVVQNPQNQGSTRAQNSGINSRYAANPNGNDPGASYPYNPDSSLPDLSNPENVISDPDVWDALLDENEGEEESVPSSTPTKELTKQILKDNTHLTKPIEPVTFLDWENCERVIKSKELIPKTFAHGYEAKTSTDQDLVDCPVQPNPDYHQRTDCSRVTDITTSSFRDDIIDTTSARKSKIGLVKFNRIMPYYDKEECINYLNIKTGNCYMYHLNGKYWGYQYIAPDQMVPLLLEVSDTLKWASNTLSSNPEPEL